MFDYGTTQFPRNTTLFFLKTRNVNGVDINFKLIQISVPETVRFNLKFYVVSLSIA